jgi:hypothetical protein
MYLRMLSLICQRTWLYDIPLRTVIPTQFLQCSRITGKVLLQGDMHFIKAEGHVTNPCLQRSMYATRSLYIRAYF